MEKYKSLIQEKIQINVSVNLEKYTTIKLGAVGDIAIVKTLEELKFLQNYCLSENIPYHIVGWGANQVLLNKRNYLFVKLQLNEIDSLTEFKEEYELITSTPLNQMTFAAKKLGLKGWEVFTGIPASFGGAICMNAGTSLGEIGNLIKSVKYLDLNGNIIHKKVTPDDFKYRGNYFLKPGEIIISGVITHNGQDLELKNKISEYLIYREKTQPLKTKNCGSVFKNDGDFKAGITIDKCGLKGLGINGIHISYLHGNFIENDNMGKAEDFERLTEIIKIELERYSGRKFELEVKIV